MPRPATFGLWHGYITNGKIISSEEVHKNAYTRRFNRQLEVCVD